MSTEYFLINHTKQHIVSFLGIPASTQREIMGNPVASAIVSCYLFEYLGDKIEWVSEYDWQKSFCNYREMTTEIIEILVAQEILTKLLPEKITDKDDDEIWWWNLKHTWMT